MKRDLVVILRHKCGHRIKWEAHKPDASVHFGFSIIQNYPCPWCGAEFGEPVPEHVTRVVFPTPRAEILAAEKLD